MKETCELSSASECWLDRAIALGLEELSTQHQNMALDHAEMTASRRLSPRLLPTPMDTSQKLSIGFTAGCVTRRCFNTVAAIEQKNVAKRRLLRKFKIFSWYCMLLVPTTRGGI